jgi:hypothetical protein
MKSVRKWLGKSERRRQPSQRRRRRRRSRGCRGESSGGDGSTDAMQVYLHFLQGHYLIVFLATCTVDFGKLPFADFFVNLEEGEAAVLAMRIISEGKVIHGSERLGGG